jgi:uncharacterized protein (TIGR00725 family)
MSERKLIAVIGDGNLQEVSEKYILAENLGRSLIDHGFRLITGGLGGIMEAASKGARSSAMFKQGDVIGILPGNDPGEANPYVDIGIPTGLDLGRNIIISHAEAVVAIGGGAGTLCEMANAWVLGRLIIAYRVEGWSGKLADRKIDSRDRYPGIPDDRVYGVNSENEVIEWLKLLPAYNYRHGKIKQHKSF